MNVLNSIKSDLLSRRLLPIVALVTVALLGAVGYAVLGGGSSSAKTPVAVVHPTTTTGASVTVAPANPTEAVSETPSGTRYQRQGGAHDPFIPLPKPIVKVKRSTVTTTTTSQTTSAGSTSPTTTTTPTPSTKTTTPAKPKKPTVEYQVAVLFGPAPASAGAPTALTPYEKVKRMQPLPSTSNQLIVFSGVSTSGKGATFVLAREAILTGPAQCLPSASQCEMINLAKGQTEELSYLQADGQTVTYQLQLVSISKLEVSPTAAARNHLREARLGPSLLRRYAVLADLRYSQLKGVVVLRSHKHH
jgi:hypothetical protein